MRQLRITKQITQRSDESIGRYFQEINKYPMVTAEEEVELSVRIRNGDNQAFEKLVVSNLRFVISVAKQYQNQGLSFSDLINEGNVGLVKAAQKFDETRGFKFISYAVWWIRQSIIQAISEQTRIVRLPMNRLSTINKIKKVMPYLEQKFTREPTDDELADHLDLLSEEVTIARINKRKQISFDAPIIKDGDDSFNLYDTIQSRNSVPTDNKIMKESREKNISRALNKLTNIEADILTKSFGLCNTPMLSLGDIAEIYDISSERIRQIKNEGLLKLKNLLKGKYTYFE